LVFFRDLEEDKSFNTLQCFIERFGQMKKNYGRGLRYKLQPWGENLGISTDP
jgi:hypothetical protein